MKIRDDVLLPHAERRINESAGKTDVQGDDFRERLAEELFQLHRGSSQTKHRSRVRERTWRELPASEKGKYRAMVGEALGRPRT